MPADSNNSQPSAEIERLIEETRRAIDNTQNFLDSLNDSDEISREHVRKFVENLEQRLKGSAPTSN